MTIVTRGGAKTWFGIDLPANVINMYKDFSSSEWQYTTWEQVHAERTKKQEIQEADKRRHKKIRACRIEVFFNDTFLFHGWFVLVRTLQKSYYLNWRNPNPKILEEVMKLFPCNQSLFDEYKEELWCEAFCKKYPRKHKNYKKGHFAFTTAWCELDEYGGLIRVFKKYL